MRAHSPSLAALLLATAAHPALAQTAPVTPVPALVPAQTTATPATPPVATTTAQTPTPTPTPRAAPVESDEETEAPTEVTVVGQRERGSVPGDIQPEQVLRPAEIRSYGASSIDELITALAPQLGSGRGQEGGFPVILINGRPTSGRDQVRNIPPEAIQRTEILPPEAAQQLGYNAEQRVINIVLRNRFRSWNTDVRAGGATRGDRYTGRAEASLTRIRREETLNLALQYDGQTPVYEADRDVIPTATGRPYSILGNISPTTGRTEVDPALSALAGRPVTIAGVPAGLGARPSLADFTGAANPNAFAPYRTLSPASGSVTANANYTRPLLGANAAFSAAFEATNRQSEQGLVPFSTTLPAGTVFSPFTNPVVLDRYLVEGGAREQHAYNDRSRLSAVINGDAGRWRWSATGTYQRTFQRTETDQSFDLSSLTSQIAAGDPTLNPFGPFNRALLGDIRQDVSRSTTQTASLELQANGNLFALPAGDVRLTLRSRFENADVEGERLIGATRTPTDIENRSGSMFSRVSLPIANRSRGVLSALGNLTLNGNAQLEQVSGFGMLRTLGYGVNWSPFQGINLVASVSRDENAPSPNARGDALVVTPNVRYFDFVRGESVEVTRITGGNPDLQASDRRTTNLTVYADPLRNATWARRATLNLQAEYTKTRTLNQVSSLPAVTAAVQAAFPTRFQRDASGQLIRVDARQVNFGQADQEQVRYGFNFFRRLGPAVPPGRFGGFGGFGPRQRATPAPEAAPPPPTPVTGDAPPPQNQTADRPDSVTPPPPPGTAGPDAQPGTDGPRGGQRGGFGGGFGGGGGRGGFGGGGGRGGFGGFGGDNLRLSLFHTWRLRNEIIISPGLPSLDLLNGDSQSDRGGIGRHRVELSAGLNIKGIGVDVSGDWNSGSYVRGGTTARPLDLNFAPLTTARFSTWINFDQKPTIVQAHPWLRGSRLRIDVANLFDTQQRVVNSAGQVPINLQPDLLNPIGRTITIGFRKLFR